MSADVLGRTEGLLVGCVTKTGANSAAMTTTISVPMC